MNTNGRMNDDKLLWVYLEVPTELKFKFKFSLCKIPHSFPKRKKKLKTIKTSNSKKEFKFEGFLNYFLLTKLLLKNNSMVLINKAYSFVGLYLIF